MKTANAQCNYLYLQRKENCGFGRGRVPESIVGDHYCNGQLQFLIKWLVHRQIIQLYKASMSLNLFLFG